MSEARCPRCHETIRLPEPLPAADASGRCPWCQETFALHELLDELPPLLQIVDVGSESTYVEGVEEEAASAFLTEDSDEAFTLGEEEPSTPVARTSPALHARPRRQKKSSPVKTVLQIIGGGLVSIPLALAILLLLKYLGVANPNLGFWPLDGRAFDHPITASQPRPVTDDDRQTEPEPEGRLLGEDMPDFGEFNPAAELEPMLEDSDADDEANLEASPPTADLSEDIEGEPNDDPIDGEPETLTVEPQDTMTDQQEADLAASGDEAEELLSIPPTDFASPIAGPTADEGNASPAQSNDDAEAIATAAKEASTVLANHSDPATLSGALKDLYLQLAKLGELGVVDQPSLHAELFAQLRSEDQLETMGRFGKPWFSAPSRLYEGLFATGTLEQQGDGYQFRWEDGETVLIEGWDSTPADADTFVGKKVALLAKIDTATEPRRLLVGYLERLDRDSEDAEQP